MIILPFSNLSTTKNLKTFKVFISLKLVRLSNWICFLLLGLFTIKKVRNKTETVMGIPNETQEIIIKKLNRNNVKCIVDCGII